MVREICLLGADKLHEYPPTAPKNPARITTSGMLLQSGIPYADWLALGRRLNEIATGSAWSLGDWLNYGERAYGQRYKSALEATRFDYQTLRNYAWVARAFEMSRRRDTLSFGHHAEVAALATDAQDRLLEQAVRGRWSRAELRRRVREQRRSDAAPQPHAPVTVRVVIAPDRERRWRAAATARGLELAEWITSAVDAAAEAALRPDLSVAEGPSRQAA